jgi:GNAT superfamily N-acetyltransferase
MVAKADTLVLREIALEDAESVARLSGELGYPVSTEEMAARIRAQNTLTDHVIYVACLAGQDVAGWIDVHITRYLQAAPRAEIGGLVVASSSRSRGIGRRLVAQAERWATDHGMTQMVVRSQIARERAHQFYLREGYQRTKTSAVFSKELPPK